MSKKSLKVIIIVELIIALCIGLTVHIDRFEQARAFVNWYNNQTPENRVVFDHQIFITNIYRLGISLFAFTVMLILTFLLSKIIRRTKKINNAKSKER